jgi:trehalose 6-phosphate phosphatase
VSVGALERVRARLDRAAVLLDFDGTLSAIVPTPEEAAAVEGAAEVLAGLVPRTLLVAIVTGRPEEQIRARLDVPGLRIVGIYGLEGAPMLEGEIGEEIRAVAAIEPGTEVEEKGPSVAVHFRNTADPDAVGVRLRAAFDELAGENGLEILEGKRVLELAPPGDHGKGAVVRSLAREVGAESALYAGDDVADIDAFAALDELAAAGAATCKVAVAGPEAPPELAGAADLTVGGPDDLLQLLRSL